MGDHHVRLILDGDDVVAIKPAAKAEEQKPQPTKDQSERKAPDTE